MTTPDTSAEVERIRARLAVAGYSAGAYESDDERDLLVDLRLVVSLLPSPAAVRQARLVAAEIVAEWIERMPTLPSADARSVANIAASHIRDRADTHSGDASLDVPTLLVLAQRVDRCTTLGELEALVAKWREVA